MSIKMKIPILIIIMLFLNSFALYAYYNYYFYDRLEEKIVKLSGKHISSGTLRDSKIVLELIRFEMLTLILIILLIGLIIYLTYSKPLIKLIENVKNYKSNHLIQTKRKDEIGQLQNAFADLAKELEEEKQIQNRIIASISHDIKTPLTNILGYSETLVKKELSPERSKHYIQIIRSGAKDIEEIVQDFDNYIEGKLSGKLNRRTYSLSFIMDMLKEEYQNDLESMGVGLSLISNGLDEEKINVDLAKLRRVFANLIGNAIKHNQYKLNLKITISVYLQDKNTIFSVNDNGKGMDEKQIPHIFEPFYTSDNSRSVSGLGLSICRNIIEAHGGRIWTENSVNGGFNILFQIKNSGS